ncbi:MAG: carbonate dehydratase [Gemmatimonadales bacterium]|nr:carbonate dehydratase [Gemmatimonadales bacterium]
MRFLQDLFARNRAWAAARREQDPQFFARLAAQQSPEYLWIGCSDSRVPANEIVGLLPGELFVHRNVANLVVHTDLNCLSVLQFAVDVLRVGHVIVTGHYGCGGIRAALENARLGLVDNWLRHVQDVREQHEPMLAALPDTGARSSRLCELNVVEQVRHVCETSIVQDAWERKQSLAVHGLIYGLDDGRLRDLGTSVAAAEDVSRVYSEAVDGLAKARPARTTARHAPR